MGRKREEERGGKDEEGRGGTYSFLFLDILGQTFVLVYNWTLILCLFLDRGYILCLFLDILGYTFVLVYTWTLILCLFWDRGHILCLFLDRGTYS